MVELFSNFTSTLVIVGVILAIGIIFEKQLIALEDKFDVYVATLRKQNRSQTITANNKKRSAVKSTIKKPSNSEGFAA